MKTLCIAPCGQRKIWKKFPKLGPQKARDVYTGPYAGKCIEYASKFYPDSWCILSAKYGFLFPDDLVLGDYNVTFKKKQTKPLAINDLAIQVKNKELDKYDKIVVLGGKDYSDMIKEVISGKVLSLPLYGLKLGQSISKMKASIENDIQL